MDLAPDHTHEDSTHRTKASQQLQRFVVQGLSPTTKEGLDVAVGHNEPMAEVPRDQFEVQQYSLKEHVDCVKDQFKHEEDLWSFKRRRCKRRGSASSELRNLGVHRGHSALRPRTGWKVSKWLP